MKKPNWAAIALMMATVMTVGCSSSSDEDAPQPVIDPVDLPTTLELTRAEQEMVNSSSVFEPVTITTEKQTYPNVNLPAVVQVKRKKLDGQRIRIESENYKFQDIVLKKAINGWAFGNILIGGLIGWGVDLMTNCVSKPSQDEYMIEPTFKRKVQNQEETE